MTRARTISALARLVSSVVVLVAPCSFAGGGAPPPRDLASRVGFDQRIGATVPLDLTFVDTDNRAATLREAANGKPLLLALGYYRCRHLCGETLRGMADAVAALRLHPGADFNVAFVSIDPREGAPAAGREQRLVESEVPHADAGTWHLMTGRERSIRPLAGALGFRYFLDPRTDEYAHATGIVVLTAGGRIAQYFFGVRYAPRSLRLAIVDASAGRLGNAIDRLVLFCCGYDPSTGRYSLLIGRVMAIVGSLFVLLLAAWLLLIGRRRRR